MLFHRKLNYYLNDEHEEDVLDILFDAENYINNFLKKDTEEKESLYNDHIYNALSVLIDLIYFTEDFKKYTRPGIVNNEFFKKVIMLTEKVNDLQEQNK